MLGFAWADSSSVALACVALASFLVTLPLALVASAIQTVTPNQMRGVVAGIYVVTTNLFGLGLGPTLVATCTDYLFADPLAVGQSLALVALSMACVGFILLWRGVAPLRRVMIGESEYEQA
ncbi:MAG: hypothetical protein D6763_02765 [Alphaproteobacteria bacterium]|nr:MAG: hypothetical protein D6763_02765 [Alphaproteobacteria bacterium]